MSDVASVPLLPQVMKRVRTEQIQYAVAQYLKRRQYVDAESPMRGAKLFQTPEEMAANLTGKETAWLGFPFRSCLEKCNNEPPTWYCIHYT